MMPFALFQEKLARRWTVVMFGIAFGLFGGVRLGGGVSCATATEVYLGLQRSGLQPIPVALPAFIDADGQQLSGAEGSLEGGAESGGGAGAQRGGAAEQQSDGPPAAAVATLRKVLLADLDFSVLITPVTDPKERKRQGGRFGGLVDELRGRLRGDGEDGEGGGKAAAGEGGGEGATGTARGAADAFWIERSELLRHTIPFPQIWEEVGVEISLSVEIASRQELPTSLHYEINFIAGGAPLATGELQLRGDNPRDLGHTLADVVVLAAAGEPGIAHSRIAYAQAGSGHTRRIVVADYDGARPQRLGDPSGEALMPSLFPGGDRVAAIRYGELGPDLVVFDVPPRHSQREIVLSARSGLESTPAVAPDGSEIAFTLNLGGNPDIYVVPAQGGTLRRLTFAPGIDTSPSWSPTGAQLVFTSDRSGSPSLYIMGKTGLAQRNLMIQPGYLDAASWSPRGDRIAFVARSGGRFHIFTIDPLGGEPVRLTDRGNNESPCWSPDGLHLVFSSDRSGVSQIYMMRLDGSALRRISGTRGAITPSWSPATPTHEDL
jgi:TolB protein